MKYSNASKFLCAQCFYHIIGQLAQEALSTQPLPWCLLRIISGAWKTTLLFGTFVSFTGAAKLKTWGSIWIPPIGFTTNLQSTLSRSWSFQFSLVANLLWDPKPTRFEASSITIGVWRNHEYPIQQNVQQKWNSTRTCWVPQLSDIAFTSRGIRTIIYYPYFLNSPG